ncbi:NifB/NifX family molybdenum-iron cluster-binding protein [Konateibacter massiliensis]|uniref:NifB/NifX family molybdenum-iron cluster-binding protein n=1 Tax=Konateibacter massiliensis TaxID=2002841 RepID=UPI000C148F8D|nr:NifB/NifX family molybdenum-iron cluster-binding protein [Konateibacter massiliensis]
MSYKIAIASSDQININLHFGGAQEFLIYEVGESGTYSLLEIRGEAEGTAESCQEVCNNGCESGEKKGGCGKSSQSDNPKVLLIADCRCVICKKVGFHIQKQLEKRAITTFDVEGSIEEALQKVTFYFNRVDRHQTLRGIANQV